MKNISMIVVDKTKDRSYFSFGLGNNLRKSIYSTDIRADPSRVDDITYVYNFRFPEMRLLIVHWEVVISNNWGKFLKVFKVIQFRFRVNKDVIKIYFDVGFSLKQTENSPLEGPGAFDRPNGIRRNSYCKCAIMKEVYSIEFCPMAIW